MCGIAGIMMRKGMAPANHVLDRLDAALYHRGPDFSGRVVSGLVALIFTRLAIVDLAHGNQPIEGPNDTVMVANGEIYNNPDLRKVLPSEIFKTRSDCEPALHLYDLWGPSYAEKLRGMYAVAIFDRKSSRLILSRDPFGIKPLYYVQTEDCFAFASEPQALIKAGLIRPELAADQRAELLQLKFTVGAETIFAGIRRVLPGQTLVIENGDIIATYQQPMLPPAKRPGKSREAEIRELDAVLTESVSAHLQSDVPVGLFLSGGIDSAALLALMQRITDRPVQAISVGYPNAGAADESFEAVRLARSVGSVCERLEIGAADFWSHAPRIAAAIDDPTADAAVLPMYMLGLAAADRHLKVTLCGEGADELFGGYARYRKVTWPHRLWSRKARSRGMFDRFPGMRAKLSGWHDGLSLAEAEAGAKAHQRSPLQVLQAIDCHEWLPNDLMTKLDRCLMIHGVEGRTPFLDPKVAQFAFGLNDNRKVGLKLGKLLLREWLSRTLPQAQAFAKKRGFNPPVGQWMAARQDELIKLVSQQPGIAEIADKTTVGAVFQNAAKDSQRAWSLLYYALWHSHHLMGIPPDGNITDVLAQAAA